MPSSSLAKRIITYRTAFILFVAVYVTVSVPFAEPGACRANASHNVLDYCQVTAITVTNESAASLTDQNVRVLLPASSLTTNSEVMDTRVWDALPVLGDVTNEVPMMAQSLTSSQSPWWFTIPDFPAGASRTLQLYSGADYIRRDAGIRFTGNEFATAGSNSFTTVAGDLDLELSFTLWDPDTARTEVLVEKRETDIGYSIQLADATTHIEFIAYIDTSSCQSTGPHTFNSGVNVLTLHYETATAGVDTVLSLNGSTIASCDLDEGAIGSTSNSLAVGAASSDTDTLRLTGAEINDIKIADADSLDVHYGFDPRRTTETNSTNPYTGTTDDYTGNGSTLTYTFDNDQSDFSFLMGPVSPNVYSPDLVLVEGNSVVGAPVTGGFENARAEVTTGILYNSVVAPLQNVATATGAPVAGIVAAFFYGVSLIAAVFVWKLTKGYTPAAVTVFGIGPTIAVVLGYVPEWSLILWGLMLIVVWFAQLRSQQES